MITYYDKLDDKIKAYFQILSPEFPEWLNDYIETPAMQRLSGISMLCGTDYSKIFNYKGFNSNLNHSIGVALIIWNFTHDKKQTLAGLFHDIATPAFKHCIDFMNGDSETQESTEEKTEDIIKNSKEIMTLLKRDGIKISEVSDYHIYPIADNDTPKLSADRCEYTFSNGLVLYDAWGLDDIKKYYENIIIVKNENNVDELCFRDIIICEEYVSKILPIFLNYHSDNNRTVMQFFADIIKSMNVKGYLTVDDLYIMSEKEVIEKIKTCSDSYIRDIFKKFLDANRVYSSDEIVQNKYCISVKSKVRYIVPLVQCNGQVKRINEVSAQADSDIKKYLKIKQSKYTWFDFDFKPYS